MANNFYPMAVVYVTEKNLLLQMPMATFVINYNFCFDILFFNVVFCSKKKDKCVYFKLMYFGQDVFRLRS